MKLRYFSISLGISLKGCTLGKEFKSILHYGVNLETRLVCIQMFLVGIVNFMHLCLNKLFNIHIGGGMKIEAN